MLPGDKPCGEDKDVEADPKKLFFVPDSFRGIFGMAMLSEEAIIRRLPGASIVVSSRERRGPNALSTASFTSRDRLGPSALSTASLRPPLLFKSRDERGRSSAPALMGACFRRPLVVESDAGVEPGKRYSTVSCLYNTYFQRVHDDDEYYHRLTLLTRQHFLVFFTALL